MAADSFRLIVRGGGGSTDCVHFFAFFLCFATCSACRFALPCFFLIAASSASWTSISLVRRSSSRSTLPSSDGSKQRASSLLVLDLAKHVVVRHVLRQQRHEQRVLGLQVGDQLIAAALRIEARHCRAAALYQTRETSANFSYAFRGLTL